MYKIIGELKIFAIEIQILSFSPSLYGKSALWVNGERIGVFEDENYLGQLIWSFNRIIKHRDEFWLAELEGLTGIDLFLAVTPFFKNELDMYTLSYIELSSYEKYDNFLVIFGENFDKWLIRIVIHDDNCVFFWYPFYDGAGDSNVKSIKLVRFYEIKLSVIIKAYEGLLDFIPKDFWPT